MFQRKKYWTLVEHDGPMRLTTTNSPEPETLVDGEDKTDMVCSTLKIELTVHPNLALTRVKWKLENK